MRESPVAPPVQAAARRADPQHPGRVVDERADGLGRQAVFLAEVVEHAVPVPPEPAVVRAGPQGPLAVDRDGHDGVRQRGAAAEDGREAGAVDPQHAVARGQPEDTVGPFGDVVDGLTAQRIAGRERLQAARVDAGDADARAHQHRAVTRAPDAEDLVAAQPVGARDPAAITPAQPQHAGILEPDPQRALPVVEHGRGLIAGKALGRAVHGEGLLAEAVQAAAGAHPEAAVAVLEQVPHENPGAQARGAHAHEAGAVEARQPVGRADPDGAVAVGDDGAHRGSRHAVGRLEAAEVLPGRQRHHAARGADPDRPVAIDDHGRAELVGHLPAFDEAVKPPAVEPHDLGEPHADQRAVGQLDQFAEAFVRHAVVGPVVDDGAVPDRRDDPAADGPHRAVARLEEIGHAGRPQAVGRAVVREAAVGQPRHARQRADPDRAVAGGDERGDEAVGQAVGALAVDGEVDAVEARQALVGADPQRAVGRLRDGAHRVLRQALLLGPAAVAVLAELFGRVQGQRGSRRRGQPRRRQRAPNRDPEKRGHVPDTMTAHRLCSPAGPVRPAGSPRRAGAC